MSYFRFLGFRKIRVLEIKRVYEVLFYFSCLSFNKLSLKCKGVKKMKVFSIRVLIDRVGCLVLYLKVIE